MSKEARHKTSQKERLSSEAKNPLPSMAHETSLRVIAFLLTLFAFVYKDISVLRLNEYFKLLYLRLRYRGDDLKLQLGE